MNKMRREQKIKDMLLQIRRDFTKMQGLLDSSLTLGGKNLGPQAYLKRQIEKYLKPLDNRQFLDEVRKLIVALQIPPLLNAAGNAGAATYRKPNWDTEGDGAEHVNWKLTFAGGWTDRGKMGGLSIRITQKAFLIFPELTLRGVMVHEATHFALDTEDIHYYTFTRNSVMKNLVNGSQNADNWRIFYQKMSEYFTTGVMERQEIGESPKLSLDLGAPFKVNF
jgi:hypothetical protein